MPLVELNDPPKTTAQKSPLAIDPVLLVLSTLDIVIEMLVTDRVQDPEEAAKVIAEIRHQALITALRAGQTRQTLRSQRQTEEPRWSAKPI